MHLDSLPLALAQIQITLSATLKKYYYLGTTIGILSQDEIQLSQLNKPPILAVETNIGCSKPI